MPWAGESVADAPGAAPLGGQLFAFAARPPQGDDGGKTPATERCYTEQSATDDGPYQPGICNGP